MKWWFFLFIRGLSIGGPFDTEQECIASLKMAIETPILDQGFDNAKPDGLCFQAIRPDLGHRP